MQMNLAGFAAPRSSSWIKQHLPWMFGGMETKRRVAPIRRSTTLQQKLSAPAALFSATVASKSASRTTDVYAVARRHSWRTDQSEQLSRAHRQLMMSATVGRVIT